MWKKLNFYNFLGIHNIRLYLPPVITTILRVINHLSPYITYGKTIFLLNITNYSYVTSIFMNICIHFVKCMILPDLRISYLMGHNIIEVNLMIQYTSISQRNTQTILDHKYIKRHTKKTIYILFQIDIICIIIIGNCFE